MQHPERFHNALVVSRPRQIPTAERGWINCFRRGETDDDA